MMPHDRKVKDKRIELKPGGHLAIVEYYRDKPARYGDAPIKELCESLAEAQRFLARYPRDFWEEPGLSDRNYKEIDERRKRGQQRNKIETDRVVQTDSAGDRDVRIFGRTFARLR